jgi:hypothetical protein
MLSVSSNIIVTCLISWVLLRTRRKANSSLPVENASRLYTNVTAILIESAAPLALFGICYAISDIVGRRLEWVGLLSVRERVNVFIDTTGSLYVAFTVSYY